MSFIQIVPFKISCALDFTRICDEIKNIFNIEVQITKQDIDVASMYDANRNQYYSTKILEKLNAIKEKNTIKIIGITEFDLFVPILTFVFGEAELNGNASIVSIQRLKNEFYGLPQNSKLLLERLTKEMIHELGHNFGLYHCVKYDCVMKSSTYVEDIDIKKINFCTDCYNAIVFQ